jgi:uncharacterized NAD-dependent epimerase/dehydratase family protein
MTELQRPRHKHPKGACWNAYRHSPDFEQSVQRIETATNARLWLMKLNEIDADEQAKELVSERWQELNEH